MCIFLNTTSTANSATFVAENPRASERERRLGREGGVLPALKMAAASGAPREFTSGFGAAGAGGLASAPPYGVGVRLGGTASRAIYWKIALRVGARIGHPATDLPSL